MDTTETVKYVDLDKLDKIFPNAYFIGYSGVCEPGYDDKPVILANWNNVPQVVYNRLEQLGYMCEWEDEWTGCSNCGKVVRTSPDCYHWQPSYAIVNDELLCLDCLDAEEYYQSIENNPRHAVTLNIAWKYPPEKFGYELVEGQFENGYFEGQNADPKAILKAAMEKEPQGRFLFVMTDQGQFDVQFAIYRKVKGEDE